MWDHFLPSAYVDCFLLPFSKSIRKIFLKIFLNALNFFWHFLPMQVSSAFVESLLIKILSKNDSGYCLMFLEVIKMHLKNVDYFPFWPLHKMEFSQIFAYIEWFIILFCENCGSQNCPQCPPQELQGRACSTNNFELLI